MTTADDRGEVLVVDPDWMLFPIVFRAVLGVLILLFAGAAAAVATSSGAASQFLLDRAFWHLGKAAEPAFVALALACGLIGGWIVWTAARSCLRRHELKIDVRNDRVVLRGRYLCRASPIEAITLGMIGQDEHYSDLAYHQVLARLKGGGFQVLAVYMEPERAVEAARRIAAFLGVAFDPARATLRRLW